jgi:crossover junction endodeoxyribonuclease RuvC
LGGALALVNCQTKATDFIADMPIANGRVDPAKLADLVEMCQVRGTIHAVVELVSSMPRQSGAFNFGVSAGIVHGCLGALGVPMTLVSPNVWKSAMGLRKLVNESQAQNKSRARELAIRLWPAQADQFKRIKDDGRAEACLLGRHFINSKGW